MSSFAQLAVAGIVLLGCGGRASSNGPGGTGTEQGGSAGVVGAAGSASMNRAGSASSVSSAGSGGAGGTPTVVLVDDEDARDGRPRGPTSAGFFWGAPVSGWHLGNWFLTSDTTRDVELSLLEPPRDGSRQARHVSGSGFESGVVLWAELDHPVHRTLDLGAYAGITFWARLESKSGVLAFALEDGSQGAPAPQAQETLPIVAWLDVGPAWQQFTLPFDDLFQGKPRAASIDFFVGAGGEAFDLWIDDVAFLCADVCR